MGSGTSSPEGVGGEYMGFVGDQRVIAAVEASGEPW